MKKGMNKDLEYCYQFINFHVLCSATIFVAFSEYMNFKDKQTVTYFFFIVYRKEKRKTKKSKKSKTKEKRKIEPLTDFYPSLPQVSIPKNPSSFAVFAAIRNTCLENKRKQDTILQVSFDDSTSDDVITVKIT